MTVATDEIIARLVVIDTQLRSLQASVATIISKENKIMVSLAEVKAKADAELAQIQAETSVVNAVKMVVDNQNAKIDDLKQQLADLIASGGADQAALQALSDTIDQIMTVDTSNAQVVADAVAAGTPAAPPT